MKKFSNGGQIQCFPTPVRRAIRATRGSGSLRNGSETTSVSTRIIQARPAGPERCRVAQSPRTPPPSTRRAGRRRSAANPIRPALPTGPFPPGWRAPRPRCCGRAGLPAHARRDGPRRTGLRTVSMAKVDSPSCLRCMRHISMKAIRRTPTCQNQARRKARDVAS